MTRPDQTPQQFGRGMIIAAWILLLVLLTWFFNDHLEGRRNPNRQLATVHDGVPEVRLERNRYGHYVATGAINGHAVEFMLDTGATDVSIPVAIADRLELQRGQGHGKPRSMSSSWGHCAPDRSVPASIRTIAGMRFCWA
jgi:aspartyl protease family protein